VQFIIPLIFLLCFLQIPAQNQVKIDSLQNVLRTAKHDSVRMKCMIKLAAEYRHSDPAGSVQLAKNALSIAMQIKHLKGKADALHVLGTAYSNKASYDTALTYLNESLKIRRSTKDKHGESVTTNNIGLVYYSRGDLENALKFYLISSKIDEDLNDKEGVASSYNNIGLILMNQKNFEKALDYYNQALNLYEEMNFKRGIAAAYSNIAGVYYYQRKLPEAADMFRKAMVIYEELGNKRGIATMCSNIAELYNVLDKPREAVSYDEKAIQLEEELGNKYGIVFACLSTSKTFLLLNDYNKAENYLQRAINLSRELKTQKQLSEALLLMAEVKNKKEDYKQAVKYLYNHIEVNDSILNSENSARITEMQTLYETDKKNKEIDLLKKEKTIQSLKQSALETKSRNTNITIVIALAFIVAIGFLGYKRYKEKQKANLLLEQKNQNIEKQKTEIEEKSNELALKNKEITDSIRYAQRIQNAILPSDDRLLQLLPNSFVFFKPKDIVSGDFYWVEPWGSSVLVAAVDCTGHGVPGAMMSVVSSNLLNQALNEFGLVQPHLILNSLNKGIAKNLQRSGDASIKDGMDISLVSIDFTLKKMQYAGVNNSAYVVREKQIKEIKAEKNSIGTYYENPAFSYTLQNVELQKNDMVYLFTDGFADQFGGESGKKFKYKPLLQLLTEIADLNGQEQKQILDQRFENWKGNLEQVDDVCIIGIRV
jgi:serine phosphatase RsbU (regulator of sigma subunit)/Tfp pilus assembly protein PilF